MASRRKYRPKGYRDGGAVKADDVAPMPDVGADVPPPPVSPSGTEWGSAPHSGDAVLRALQATRHAEELQRQAAQQPRTVADHIDAMPISEHKKRFLREHPDMLDGMQAKALAWHYQAALAAGVEDDSSAMDHRLREGVRRDMEIMRQRQIESAQPAYGAVPQMPPPTPEHAAERLDDEAGAIRAAMSAQTPISTAADLAEIAPSQPAPSRRSLPISAPVSRDVPTASGQRRQDMRSMTLSPEEREIARTSFSSDLSIEQREKLYAMNKAKLARMRADGVYPERERN